MKTKPHGMTGKRNAAKDDGATATIQLRVKPAFKTRLKDQAKAEGLTLTEWILNQLNP